MNERRLARSQFTDQALHAWLGAVARRTATEAIVVADDVGLLIGGGIEGAAAEEMAAFAVKTPLLRGATALDALHGRPLTVRRLDWDGEALYVAAIGDLDRASAGLDEAVAGVDRILREGVRPVA